MTLDLDANAVVKVARKVANCGFQVIVSRNVTSDGYAWILKVGESDWWRKLAIEEILDDGEDAKLALLVADPEVDKWPSGVERRLTLKELIAGSDIGVEKVLKPAT